MVLQFLLVFFFSFCYFFVLFVLCSYAGISLFTFVFLFVIVIRVGLLLSFFGWCFSGCFGSTAFLADLFAAAISFEFFHLFGVFVFGFDSFLLPFLLWRKTETKKRNTVNTWYLNLHVRTYTKWTPKQCDRFNYSMMKKIKVLTLLSFNPLQSSPPRLATSVTLMPGFSRLIDSRLSFNHNMYAESGRFGRSAILLGCLLNEIHENVCVRRKKTKMAKSVKIDRKNTLYGSFVFSGWFWLRHKKNEHATVNRKKDSVQVAKRSF